MNTVTILILVACAVGVLAVIAIALVVVLYIRHRIKNKQEYIKIQIEESLSRKVAPAPELPTTTEKRDDALMNARYYLRTSNFELSSPLWRIGKNEKKYNFLVSRLSRPGRYLMTLQAKGPNSVLALESSTVKQTIKELLETVRHPYILPATEANFLAGKKSVLITIRPWAIKGSLKDLIYKSKPDRPYDEKYGGYQGGKALNINQVRQFGRQILEALTFLNLLGYTYPDLHSGNVIVFDGICKLTDLENVLMGHKSHYSSFSKDQNQLRDFGCLLFEMVCGREPQVADIKSPPPNCHPSVNKILHSIFIQQPPSTLVELIALPFFNVTPKGLTADAGDEVDFKPAYSELFTFINEKKPMKVVPRANSSKKVKSVKSASATPIKSPTSTSSPSATNLTPRSSAPISAPPPPPMSSPVGIPAPPPPPSGTPSSTSDRSSLLASIRTGTSLKKAVTNDRSGPLV